MAVSMLVITATLSFLLSAADCTLQSPTPPPPYNRFITCLQRRINATNAASDLDRDVIFTPKDAAFTPTLQAYIRNSRFNRTTTPKPFAIVTAKRYSHVQAAVLCAKQHKVQLRIRSGGHDFEGLSYVSHVPFVVLDMFNLRKIKIDVKKEVAWVQAGAILGEIYYNVAKESNNTLAFPGGICSTVGAGGHISGGGYGPLMRKYGLSADNILDAEVVDANGRIFTRRNMGDDFFWAIRGGGGSSFGVILAWKLRLVRVPKTVTVFSVKKTQDQGAIDVMDQWQRFAPAADPNLFIRVEPRLAEGSKTTVEVAFIALYLGGAEELVAMLKKGFPLLGLELKDTSEVTWARSTLLFMTGSLEGPLEKLLDRDSKSPNYLSKHKSDYFKEPVPKEGWERMFNTLIKVGREAYLQFEPYGGKMSEIAEDAIAFPHRAGNLFKMQYLAVWEDEDLETEKRNLKAVDELYDIFTPYASKNPREAFLCYRDLDIGTNADSDLGFAHDYFKGNLPRLLRTKAKVDPDNFFRDEQSLPVKAN